MIDERVQVFPYDPAWVMTFEQERARLIDALGEVCVDVKHVGSTSVPGLVAKPIVDVLVGARAGAVAEAGTLLVASGYEDVGRYFQRRGPADLNVTLTEHGSADWVQELLFRDYLRAHPEDARRYGDVKLRAAELHADHDAYAAQKRGLILELLDRARDSQAEARP